MAVARKMLHHGRSICTVHKQTGNRKHVLRGKRQPELQKRSFIGGGQRDQTPTAAQAACGEQQPLGTSSSHRPQRTAPMETAEPAVAGARSQPRWHVRRQRTAAEAPVAPSQATGSAGPAASPVRQARSPRKAESSGSRSRLAGHLKRSGQPAAGAAPVPGRHSNSARQAMKPASAGLQPATAAVSDRRPAAAAEEAATTCHGGGRARPRRPGTAAREAATTCHGGGST